MAYRVEFTSDAKADLRRVESSRARALIRRALERLEREGPCIGVRLRGTGRQHFCRLGVPEHAKNTWRIVYQWPPPSGEPSDLIWVWVVREHTAQPEADVYLWLDILVQRRGAAIEPWSAGEPRRRCCAEG
jgi:mRNA-degrading endonuclease RelE of RelBE toxin-antitoxin system